MNAVVLKKRKLRLWFRSLREGSKKYALVLRILTYILALDIAFVFLFPFLYMIITSLKTSADLFDMTVNWIPTGLHWQNYADAFEMLNYPRHLLNSLIITAACTAGHLISCSWSAYGLARFNFAGKKLLFILVVFAIIVPAQVVVLPQYMMYVRLDINNTYIPIILPAFLGFGLKGGLYIFIFRQYFRGLPRALEDAAKIDGYGPFMIFIRIIAPIARPVYLVTGILGAVWHWNDYYEPSIYLGKISTIPLPAMLPAIYQEYVSVPDSIETARKIVTEGTVMAATFLVVLPVLILFFIVQRAFTQGIERSGLVE